MSTVFYVSLGVICWPLFTRMIMMFVVPKVQNRHTQDYFFASFIGAVAAVIWPFVLMATVFGLFAWVFVVPFIFPELRAKNKVWNWVKSKRKVKNG